MALFYETNHYQILIVPHRIHIVGSTTLFKENDANYRCPELKFSFAFGVEIGRQLAIFQMIGIGRTLSIFVFRTLRMFEESNASHLWLRTRSESTLSALLVGICATQHLSLTAQSRLWINPQQISAKSPAHQIFCFAINVYGGCANY